jgi:hypothetical protein
VDLTLGMSIVQESSGQNRDQIVPKRSRNKVNQRENRWQEADKGSLVVDTVHHGACINEIDEGLVPNLKRGSSQKWGSSLSEE